MSLQENNLGQNNDISSFMNEKHFCQGSDWFLVCYPRRRKSNASIFGLFLKYPKIAAVYIDDSCSEPPFDNFVFSFQIYQLRHICSGPNDIDWLIIFFILFC